MSQFFSEPVSLNCECCMCFSSLLFLPGQDDYTELELGLFLPPRGKLELAGFR